MRVARPLLRNLPLAVALVVALLAAGFPAAAEGKRAYVYVVVVDGLDGDAVESGKAPFLSSLLAGEGGRSTYFPRSRSVIPAETNPNHVAMMTGAYPGKSGIAANAFAVYAPLANPDSCATTGPFDFSVIPSPTSGESPTCPQAETVFEAVRRKGGKRRPVTAAIMGKPKLGRIFDVGFRGQRAADYLWAPCDDTAEDDGYCESVSTNPITGYAVSDTVVMDEVIESITEGVPTAGGVRVPDFTFVNLPQVDSAGHALGRGPAYDAAIGLADRELARLVATLKETRRWHRSVLTVVSDHSMDTTLQKINLTSALEDAGVPESSFRVVGNGSVDFVYVAGRGTPAAHRTLATIRGVVQAQPGIQEALYRRPNPVDGGKRDTVAARRRYWSAGERTGDLVVTAKPGYAFTDPGTFQNPLVGNHGAPQTADNFLALTGGYWRLQQGTSKRVASNVDLAATISGLLRARTPKQNQGKALKPAFRPRTFDRPRKR